MNSSKQSRIYYTLAVVALAGFVAAMQFGTFTLLKKALPIRRSLKDMNRSSLSPYEFIRAETLSAEVVHELGTQEYIDWALRDSSAPIPAAKTAKLSITYYTDMQDQVPHVPEECYQQNTFSQDRDETIEMDFPRLGRKLDVRRLEFFPPQEFKKKTIVYYLFGVNGEFYSGRNGVRQKIADPRDTHLYYSKVEVAFNDATDANLPELDQRARNLLENSLVELIANHWPEKGSERGGPGKVVSSSSREQAK